MQFLHTAATALALCLTAATAIGQAPKPVTGSTGGPTTTGSAPPIFNPSTINPNTTTSGSNSKFPGDQAHPLFITGKVSFQDGAEPGQPVLIERVCTGRPHPEGYTDAKGNFSLRLGQEMDVVADASETQSRNQSIAPGSGGVRDSQLAVCELRAVLSGYRSETVQLASRKYMDNPDIGTIVLRPLVAVEGLTMSATTALAPKDAHKAFEKGMESMHKMKLADAESELHRAVEIYPKYAAAWVELGHVLERESRSDEARYAYAQSIVADSHYVSPFESLYLLAFHEKKWQECADNTEKVMHLDPYNYPAAFYYNALSNLELHNLSVAEKSGRQAVAFDTQHINPQGMYVLGVILAQRKDFQGAADNLRGYLRFSPDGPEAPQVRKVLTDVERIMAEKAATAHAASAAPQPDKE
jgi:tetratricopeptide (TPR) repeat protein